MSTVVFNRPFYDGLGSPLIGAEVTLRDATGATVYYTCAEIKESGFIGCYKADVDISMNYFIYIKTQGSDAAVCIGEWSPAFIPSYDLS